MDCFGEGCQGCFGEGFIRFTKLPEITAARTLFQAFSWFKEYKLLPAPGTWTEQTAKFIKAVGFCESTNMKLVSYKEEQNRQTEEFYEKNKGKHG